MVYDKHTAMAFHDFGFRLVSSTKEEIIHSSSDDSYYVFFYPNKNLLNIRKVLGQNADYNMPIIDINIDRSFKVDGNITLIELLKDLCK